MSQPKRRRAEAPPFWSPPSDDALLAAALQVNARASWRDLASLVDSSESTVARRVRALISSQVVRATVIVDPIRSGIGLPVTVLFRVSNKSLRALADHLVARPDVRLAAVMTGEFALLADFIVPSLAHLQHLVVDELAAVDATFESTLQPVLREFKTTVDWAQGLVAGIPGVRTPWAGNGGDDEPAPLNPIDQQLADLLHQDGRMSFADLGVAVGLSESAVRRRIDLLIRSRRIHPVTLVDAKLLGFDAQAFVWLNVEPASVDRVARVLAARPEVRYLAALGGSSDLFMEVLLPSPSDLHDFRTGVLGTLGGVTNVGIAMNVQTLKRAYLPTPQRARTASAV